MGFQSTVYTSWKIPKMQSIPIVCAFLILKCFLVNTESQNISCVLEKEGDMYVLVTLPVCSSSTDTISSNWEHFVQELTPALDIFLGNFPGFTMGYKIFTMCGNCFNQTAEKNLTVLVHVTSSEVNFNFDFYAPAKIELTEDIMHTRTSPEAVKKAFEDLFIKLHWNVTEIMYEKSSKYIEFQNEYSANYCTNKPLIITDFTTKEDVIKNQVMQSSANATAYFGKFKDFVTLFKAFNNTRKTFIYCCLQNLHNLQSDYGETDLTSTVLLYYDLQGFGNGFEAYITTFMKYWKYNNANITITVNCQNKPWQNGSYMNERDIVQMFWTYDFTRSLYKNVYRTCVPNFHACKTWASNSSNVTSEMTQFKRDIENLKNFKVAYKLSAYYVQADKSEITLTCSKDLSLPLSPSSCNNVCPSWKKKVINGSCCAKCYDCPNGTFSNGTECLPIMVAHKYVIYILSPAGILLCAVALFIFLTHANTPIVKSSGGGIFYCYLAGLIIAFSSAFLFTEMPTDDVCRICLPLAALGFSLCVSSILAKSCRILLAFSSTSERPSKFQLHFYIVIIVLGTLGNAVICLMWMLIDPLRVKYLPEGQRFTNVVCDLTDSLWCILCFGYLALLCLATWSLAIKSTALPPSFIESHSISFSMLFFLTIWSCTLLITLNQSKDLQAVMFGVSIVLSSWCILGCITLPKVFIILWRPQKNTQQWINYLTYEYCRHVAYEADLNFKAQHLNASSTETVFSVDL
ncbi:uncharacterized protein LOC120542938 isoform X2 [Polypterus senegalus]|uniref:uncharacterized protein LOC120542938 isoform X2 n=1 Tax=Polypterus senegalus TaxID=55291 RepID=UPI00196439AD|nr:uncharacterized protein LOC120542938 isoform X2 [Polypterus senegalus]